MKRVSTLLALAAAVALPASASAQAFNGGLVAANCTGQCGVLGADGVVTLSGLAGATKYGYVTTNGSNAMANTVGNVIGFGLGGETNGSKYLHKFSTTLENTATSFRFQFVGSDGTNSFIEYGYAKLNNLSNSTSTILFHARTNPSSGGNMVPGFGLPAIAATLTPNTTAGFVGPSNTVWSPLGGSSGSCFGGIGAGCGRSGWIDASFNILEVGNYELELGVINWGDESLQSGLAFDFALGAGNIPVIPGTPVPEPMTISLLAAGLAAIIARRRRNA